MNDAHKPVIRSAAGGLLLAVVLTAGGSFAQDSSPILRKQAREVEQRSVTRPAGPEVDQLRRQLQIDSGGRIDDQDRIIRRQLDRVPREPLTGDPDRDPPREGARQLPDSVGTGREPLPSIAAQRAIASGGSSDDLTTASRLVDRAQRSLDANDPARAQSDATLARRMLEAMPEAGMTDAAAQRRAAALARLVEIEGKL